MMTALAPVLDSLTLSVTEETRVQASLDALEERWLSLAEQS